MASPSGSVFLSYSHRDQVFVERLRADITQAGLSVWIDHAGLQPGTDNWEKSIRAAIKGAEAVIYVASENAYSSNYCQGELAVARAYGRKIYPVFATGHQFVDCIPTDMIHTQYVDMRDDTRYAAGLPVLLNALGVAQTNSVSALSPAEPERMPIPADFRPSNPYKGLEAFTAADRANFFGRSRLVHEIAEMVESLTTERFLAIVGPSGAGKSSVVLAGLLPSLSENHPDWVFLPNFVPGDRPLEALAISLRTQLGGAIADFERDLRESDMRGVIKHTKTLLTKPSQRVILFIDQFEELFTQTPLEREAERRQFIDLLTTAALDSRAQVIVLLTLRADFMDRVLAYDELTGLVQRHTYLMPPLSIADLREVVEEPARQQHLTFDPDLAADLVFAVRDQVGALPLLQFTLDQLYQRRDGLRLTRAAYDAIGGLRGALAKHAESTYAGLPSDAHRNIAHWLFLRLIEPGSTEQDTTRRRAVRNHLIPDNAADAAIAAEVINTFIQARLLISGEGDTIEVAHEALLREWPTLTNWLQSARVDLPTQKALVIATADWLNAGAKPDDERLAGPIRLREFTEWAIRNRMSADERRYLNASQTRQAELDQHEQQRTVALEMATRRARRNQLRALFATLVAIPIIVVAIVAAYIAFQAGNAANLDRERALQDVVHAYSTLTPIALQVQESKNLSVSLQMAAQANTVLQDEKADKLPAALLAIRGLKAAYSPQADAALVRALESGYEKQWLAGHTSYVFSVAFSPDGKTALTGSGDGTARLWDVTTGQPIRTFTGHTSSVISVAFSPDGKTALTGSGDKTVQLWDVATGQTIRTFAGHTDTVSSAVFSSDGKTALTGSADGTARLWDVATGQTIRTFTGHMNSVFSVAFSPDGKSALTGSYDNTARLWDVATGQTIHTYIEHRGAVASVAFSPDSRTALTGGWDNTARLWDVATGQTIRTFTGHTSYVMSVAFSPDGTTALTGSTDNTARLWDVATGETIRTLTGHSDYVNSVAFSPDGKTVLTGSQDKTARLWDVANFQPLRTLGHESWVNSVAFSPDGKTALTRSTDGTARLWDVATGQTLRALFGNGQTVNSVAFSPDGKTALTGNGEKAALLWDVASGQTLHTFTGHTDVVNSVAFSPDGKTALTGSADKTALLWDVATGQTIRTFTGHTGAVTSVAFSPNGTTALTGSTDGTARLWDMATGQTLRTLTGHTDAVTSVVFSPDGKTALTGSYDNTAQLWDMATGQALLTFNGHTSYVNSVAFSPDGRTVLTGSQDKTARLWDVASGQTIRTLTGHTGTVASVAFSPDGKTALTGSWDKTARLWDVDYRAFIAYACTRIWRDFTPDERTQFNIDLEPTCPRFVGAVIGYVWDSSGTLTPVFNGPMTTPLPPTSTALPITLPAFTAIVSPTISPTLGPTKTAMPTATATYPGVLLTFTPSPTEKQP